jgi:hypothetical protein
MEVKMKIKKKRSLAFVLSFILLILCSGCTFTENNQEENNQPENNDKEEVKKDDTITETQVFADRNFLNGFQVKSQTDGIPTPIGSIVFEESTSDPSWNIGQWYCGYYHKEDKDLYDSYNILNVERTDKNTKHTFIDASKKVSVDTDSGEIYMRLEATKEYISPRESEQPWPHLLFEYNTSDTFYLKDLKSLRFDMEFMLTKMQDGFESASQIDTNLHTAQFVFYIVVKNTNANSPDFNQYIWFGLNLYDARWEIVPAYASQDSGKEINTGAFIYQPISSTYCKYPTKIGETQIIDSDLLPRIEDALKAAQQAGFLVNTTWDDLSLAGGNFGLEVTGTYDIAVDISKLNLWAGQ